MKEMYWRRLRQLTRVNRVIAEANGEYWSKRADLADRLYRIMAFCGTWALCIYLPQTFIDPKLDVHSGINKNLNLLTALGIMFGWFPGWIVKCLRFPPEGGDSHTYSTGSSDSDQDPYESNCGNGGRYEY